MFVQSRRLRAGFPQRARSQLPDMRLGRGLLTGTGWAGTIGGIALCVLMFLFTYVAVSGAPKTDRVSNLPSVREGRAALGRSSPRPGTATPVGTAPLPPGRGAPSPTPARLTPSGSSGGGDGLSP